MSTLSQPAAGRWRVVLPVKGTATAKSRLAVSPDVSRAALARAMALDTLAAVQGCELVGDIVLVTSDPLVAAAALDAGARVVPDPGQGLDAAVLRGASSSPAGGPVAVLLADVPALTATDLTTALLACAGQQAAFVPDAEGTGTVLLAAAELAWLRPEFGAGSALRHSVNAKRLDLDLPRLRRDVDVAASLDQALALGVGPRTAAALAAAD